LYVLANAGVATDIASTAANNKTKIFFISAPVSSLMGVRIFSRLPIETILRIPNPHRATLLRRGFPEIALFSAGEFGLP
jgi:hypothetical protein